MGVEALGAGRVRLALGPARARWIGRPETGMLRVELRDAGRPERPTATAFARVAPAPAAAPGEEP